MSTSVLSGLPEHQQRLVSRIDDLRKALNEVGARIVDEKKGAVRTWAALALGVVEACRRGAGAAVQGELVRNQLLVALRDFYMNEKGMKVTPADDAARRDEQYLQFVAALELLKVEVEYTRQLIELCRMRAESDLYEVDGSEKVPHAGPYAGVEESRKPAAEQARAAARQLDNAPQLVGELLRPTLGAAAGTPENMSAAEAANEQDEAELPSPFDEEE